jgi:Trypsin-like peptidase domain
MRRYVRVLSLSSTILCASLLAGTAGEAKKVYKQTAPSVVSISDPLFRCSGIIVSAKGLILAPFSAVNSPLPVTITVKVRTGETTTVKKFTSFKLVGVHPGFDAALIRIDPGKGLLSALALPDKVRVEPADGCFVFGMQQGGEGATPSFRPASIALVARKLKGLTYIEINASVTPASCGGVVTSGTGRPIGMLTVLPGQRRGQALMVPLDKLTKSAFRPAKERKELLEESKEHLKSYHRCKQQASGLAGEEKSIKLAGAQLALRLAAAAAPLNADRYYELGKTLLGRPVSSRWRPTTSARPAGEESAKWADCFFTKALQLDPNHVQTCMLRARRAEIAKKHDEAAGYWRRVLASKSSGRSYSWSASTCASKLARRMLSRGKHREAYYLAKWAESLSRSSFGRDSASAVIKECKSHLDSSLTEVLTAKTRGYSTKGLADFVAMSKQDIVRLKEQQAKAARPRAVLGAIGTKAARVAARSGKPRASLRAVKIPEEVTDMKLAYGGAYLLLRYSVRKELGVVDLAAGKLLAPIPTPDNKTVFAAGGKYVAFYSPSNKTFERWDLEKRKRVNRAVSKVPGLVSHMAMGLNEGGQALISYAKGTGALDRRAYAMLDLETMQHQDCKGRFHNNSYRDRIHIRTNPDLTAVTMWCTSHSPQGLIFGARKDRNSPWTVGYEHSSYGSLVPSHDGTRVYSSRGSVLTPGGRTVKRLHGSQLLPVQGTNLLLKLDSTGRMTVLSSDLRQLTKEVKSPVKVALSRWERSAFTRDRQMPVSGVAGCVVFLDNNAPEIKLLDLGLSFKGKDIAVRKDLARAPDRAPEPVRPQLSFNALVARAQAVTGRAAAGGKGSSDLDVDSEISEVKLALGGAYLAIGSKTRPGIALLNMGSGKIDKRIPTSQANALFAAGGRYLLVYEPGKRSFEKWDLETGKKTWQGGGRVDGTVTCMVMGLAEEREALIACRMGTGRSSAVNFATLNLSNFTCKPLEGTSGRRLEGNVTALANRNLTVVQISAYRYSSFSGMLCRREKAGQAWTVKHMGGARAAPTASGKRFISRRGGVLGLTATPVKTFTGSLLFPVQGTDLFLEIDKESRVRVRNLEFNEVSGTFTSPIPVKKPERHYRAAGGPLAIASIAAGRVALIDENALKIHLCPLGVKLVDGKIAKTELKRAATETKPAISLAPGAVFARAAKRRATARALGAGGAFLELPDLVREAQFARGGEILLMRYRNRPELGVLNLSSCRLEKALPLPGKHSCFAAGGSLVVTYLSDANKFVTYNADTLKQSRSVASKLSGKVWEMGMGAANDREALIWADKVATRKERSRLMRLNLKDFSASEISAANAHHMSSADRIHCSADLSSAFVAERRGRSGMLLQRAGPGGAWSARRTHDACGALSDSGRRLITSHGKIFGALFRPVGSLAAESETFPLYGATGFVHVRKGTIACLRNEDLKQVGGDLEVPKAFKRERWGRGRNNIRDRLMASGPLGRAVFIDNKTMSARVFDLGLRYEKGDLASAPVAKGVAAAEPKADPRLYLGNLIKKVQALTAKAARLPAGGSILRLPAQAAEAIPAYGGAYLLVTVKDGKELLVFDLLEPKLAFTVPLEDPKALFATGGRHLWLYHPKTGNFEKWDLEKKKSVLKSKGKFKGVVTAMVMGLANEDQALIGYANDKAASAPSKLGTLNLRDLTLKPCKGKPRYGRFPVAMAFRADPTLTAAIVLPRTGYARGLTLMRRSDDRQDWILHYLDSASGFTNLLPRGRLIITGRGQVFGADTSKITGFRSAQLFPVHGSDLFIRMTEGKKLTVLNRYLKETGLSFTSPVSFKGRTRFVPRGPKNPLPEDQRVIACGATRRVAVIDNTKKQLHVVNLAPDAPKPRIPRPPEPPKRTKRPKRPKRPKPPKPPARPDVF